MSGAHDDILDSPLANLVRFCHFSSSECKLASTPLFFAEPEPEKELR